MAGERVDARDAFAYAPPSGSGPGASIEAARARLARVEQLFHAVLARPIDERADWLRAYTPNDAGLVDEVLVLLAADADAAELLDTRPPGAAADALHRLLRDATSSGLVGTGRGAAGQAGEDEDDTRPALRARLQAALGTGYQVERELDGGGMSRVFVAADVQLGRRVAVKVVLAPEIGLGFDVARFRREVRLAATLRHPHIVPLLAAGESSDGLVYYTMPFIDGESLKQRLDREHTLPLDDVVHIVSEVAGALSYAHRRGIVHRDVKPANILLDEEHALVADFGIAKALADAAGADAAASSPDGVPDAPDDAALTSRGLILGTPAYISPEQAAGDRAVDARTDVYGLGAVAYELLTGTRPPSSIGARRRPTPVTALQPVSTRRPDAPPGIDSVVAKALARDPDDRWPTASAFAHALADAAGMRRAGRHAAAAPVFDAHSTPAVAPVQVRVRRVVAWLAAGCGVAAVAGLGAVRMARDTRDAGRPQGAAFVAAAPVTLAVLPFDDLRSSGGAYFAEGLSDEVRARLVGVPELRVASKRPVTGRAATADSTTAIGRALGVAYVLDGRVQQERSVAGVGPDRVRVTAELTRVRDGAQLWAGRYDGTTHDVFAVERAIGDTVAAMLLAPSGREARATRDARPTENFDAYNYFLRAEALRQSTTDESASKAQAVVLYERATALDPGFALAYARLAEVHSDIYWSDTDRSPQRLARVEAAATTAVRLAPALAEAHLAMALFYYRALRDYNRALGELATAIAHAPTRSDLIAWRGLIQRRQGRYADAVRSLRRADELEPSDPWRASDVAYTYALMRAYPEAERYYNRVRTLAPDWAVVHADLGFVALAARGDVDEARRRVREGLRTRDGAEVAARIGSNAPFLVPLGADTQRLLRAMSVRAFKGDTAAYLLWNADWWRQRGAPERQRAYADSARVLLARRLGSRMQEPGVHDQLAFAYAELGRPRDALRESDRALALLPLSRDALDGATYLANRAYLYTLVGEPDAAVATLRQLLTIPSFVSVPLLRLSPMWDALRGNPGFAQLVAAAPAGPIDASQRSEGAPAAR